tara:strand:- start:29 stop:472 length:444 start_codon:yes stop_codon:yes gene_type:complete
MVTLVDSGRYLYKRSFNKLTKKALLADEARDFNWFALTPGYGSDDYYGPIVSTWAIRAHPLKLLNLSTMQRREKIAHLLNISVVQIEPDEQYSGGSGNRRVHRLLAPLLNTYGLDGTYINDSEADEECEGPTEVVLTRAGLPRIAKT